MIVSQHQLLINEHLVDLDPNFHSFPAHRPLINSVLEILPPLGPHTAHQTHIFIFYLGVHPLPLNLLTGSFFLALLEGLLEAGVSRNEGADLRNRFSGVAVVGGGAGAGEVEVEAVSVVGVARLILFGFEGVDSFS